MFETFELSRFAGRPIRLFVFTMQSKVWRYCSADRDVVIGGNTYRAAQIDRSEIKQTAERAKDKITIRFAYLRDPGAAEYPATQELGDEWFPYIPSTTVYVRCMETHYGDPAPPVVQWMGRVIQPKFSDTELELTCEPTNGFAAARNQGAKWQRACWKTLYSTGLRGCNLDPDTFAVAATLEDVSGLTVRATAFADAPLSLAGGWLLWERNDGLIDRRSIMEHGGTALTLLYGAPPASLAPGTSVIARIGCAHTWDACDARGNTLNYGGSVYKPIKNPKDGVSMSWG